MTTVADRTSLRQHATPAVGRRAYGAHRAMSPAQKARNVAASITASLAEGRPWSSREYGLDGNAAQIALVEQALQPGGAQ